MTSKLIISAIALGLSSTLLLAQDAAPGGGRPGGPGGPGGRPVPPIVAALDANKDGEIDAAEIANASAALKALDKNGDGKLSGDEIRPARGEGGGPGGNRRRGGPGGPNGQGGAGGGAEQKKPAQ